MDIDAILGTTKPVAASIPRKSAIYVWGYNQSGQTGRKEKDDQLRIPKRIQVSRFYTLNDRDGNQLWMLAIKC